ncbi:pyridoxal phosphate-dependent aminotransferase [Adhaeribacter soli]|uniref:Aminotransferase n=1 Tax=Adhaeribacter soli TaxID=2607655 RepID=A0A5N1J7T4_9BACT|nr:aminotransferase class I/II-fold pyridoxal phosphate-dependent enzyme [Adhaeribacter soli]KAA9346032.1 aminotransferase class I/II-fold pyridoxal phosphate-dependent enzyme [Adhaeribacter soli]
MKYLNLASGASHFNSPPAAIEATINALKENETFYGETEGLPALREAVARLYPDEKGVKISAENVLITSGTKQALFNLFSILLQPGDEVLLLKPSWFGFEEMFRLTGTKPVYLETLPEENYTLQPELLESHITGKTRLFIFSNPGNPSGKIYSKTEISGWLQVLQKYPEIKILSDEIYDQIVFDNRETPSLLQFEDPQNKHLVVNGFSKNYGMSGWRIGYMVAPPEIINKAVHYQHATISGVNPFIQAGAVAALETPSDYLPGRIKELTQNREILCNWLSGRKEISYFRPEGAYYVFADLSRLLQQEKLQKPGLTSTAKLCELLQQELKLEFVPGERFGLPGFVRITFAVTPSDLQEALQRLENFLSGTTS